MSPSTLATLVETIDDLADKEGCILEIGTARGMTTHFLATHMKTMGRVSPYFAIDTFSGFARDDIQYEITVRDKTWWHMNVFWNSYNRLRKDMKKFEFVTVLKDDANTVDLDAFGPIKMVFLDVDLYQPVKTILPRLYERVVPGGCILVDDMQKDDVFDGGGYAFREFCDERGLTPEFKSNNLGVIRIPEAS